MKAVRRWGLVLAVFLLLGAGGYWWRVARLSGLYDASRIGRNAPVLELNDLEGSAKRLHPGQGRALLINFWASWCAPCRAEIPMLTDVQRQFGGARFSVVGIGLDAPAALRQAAAGLGINYPVYVADPRVETISRQLGDLGGVLPYSVLVDGDGVILALQVGAMSRATARAWADRVWVH